MQQQNGDMKFPKELKEAQDFKQVVESFSNFVFDCDGVLWHGDHALEGIPEMLAYLRAQGKHVFYVTNNATKSRQQFKEKMVQLGLQASVEEIYGSAYAAAAYLKRTGFSKKVFVVGMEGIEAELDAVGIAHCGGSSYPLPDPDDIKFRGGWNTACNVDLDPAIGAVIAGFDSRFNYQKMTHASLLVRYNPGCLFIATNTDANANASNGRVVPGGGTMVRSIELAANTQATVVGKPEPFLLDEMIQEHNLDRKRTVMVGDNLDTDIQFGQRGGLSTLLVLTGVTTREMLQAYSANGDGLPTFFCDSAASLKHT